MGCGKSSTATAASREFKESPILCRPSPDLGDLWTLSINKVEAQTPLGIVLVGTSEEEFISVIDLKDSGLVPEWNAQHPAQQLRKGDLLVSVNGTGGTGKVGYNRIISELRKVGEMHIVFKRGSCFVEDQHGGCCTSPTCCFCLQTLDSDSDTLQLSCGHSCHAVCARKQLQQCESLDEAICPACWNLDAALVHEDLLDGGIDENLFSSQHRLQLFSDRPHAIAEERTFLSTAKSLYTERTTQSMLSVGSVASTASVVPLVRDIPMSPVKKSSMIPGNLGKPIILDTLETVTCW